MDLKFFWFFVQRIGAGASAIFDEYQNQYKHLWYVWV